MTEFHTIYVPKRVNSDALIACFLLQKFGESTYPGIAKSQVETVDELPEDKDAWLLEDEGALSVFFKESSFPRGTGFSMSRQVARKLKVEDNFVVHTFVSIAEGRTNSETASVSRLLDNLIKQFANRSHKTFWTVRPVLQSQMSKFERQFTELPEKYTIAFEAGKVEADEIKSKKGSLRVITIESNDSAMAHFLHTHEDIIADVVCQKYVSGDVHVSAHKRSNVDLSDVVAVLRVAEIQKKEKELLYVTVSDLRAPGNVLGVEEWYFDFKNQDIFHRPKSHEDKTYLELRDIKKLLKLALSNKKNTLFEGFSEDQMNKLSNEEKERRESRMKEIEGKIYSLKKKDIVFID